MKVNDLIALLKDGTLKFEEKVNDAYSSLYSPTVNTGRRFIEKNKTIWR